MSVSLVKVGAVNGGVADRQRLHASSARRVFPIPRFSLGS